MRDKSLVVKGSGGGGLGDRIKSVLTGICYAKLSDRKLFIDWKDGVYAPPGTNAFDALFELIDTPALEKLPLGRVFPTAWQNRLGETMHDVWTEDGHTEWNRAEAIEKYSFDLSRLNYDEDVLVMWEFDQTHKLQKFLATDSDIGTDNFLANVWPQTLQKHLRPCAELRTAIDAFIKTNFENKKTIGVHIRASNEYQNQKGEADIQQYLKTIAGIRKANPGSLVFLATDNDKIIETVTLENPDTVTRGKWFAQSGESLHLNQQCPDTLQSAKDAVIEMFLLARCDYLLRPAASSFSAISEFASTAPPENKIRLQPKTTLAARAAGKMKRIMSASV